VPVRPFADAGLETVLVAPDQIRWECVDRIWSVMEMHGWGVPILPRGMAAALGWRNSVTGAGQIPSQ